MSETSATTPVPVLFVAGTGRSGSTVLANVLGQLPGCVSVGEVRFVWERGIQQDRLCGCGETFATCPFWTEVLTRAFGADVPDAERIKALQAEPTRLRSLPAMLLRREPANAELADALRRLYAAVAEVSGARVVVDSSKLPTYAALLDRIGGLDLFVLHLVRDPRAAAFSWRRKKALTDTKAAAFMERRGVMKSVALWLVWNRGLEALWRGRPDRYTRKTYESFIADPEGTVRSVAAWAGTTVPDGLFPEPGTVRMDVSHTVAGNPARLTHGVVPLRLDDEWRRAMPTRDRRLVTLGAAPLMRRYGY